MLRASFVPPPVIRLLRDLTCYRADLVEARTTAKQRVEKALEDAQIKLSVVASDIFGRTPPAGQPVPGPRPGRSHVRDRPDRYLSRRALPADYPE